MEVLEKEGVLVPRLGCLGFQDKGGCMGRDSSADKTIRDSSGVVGS